MNILKTLAGKNWGADSFVLKKPYMAIVRSKLDYGCFIYGTACGSSINKLETINNEAARIITGAFRSSPINSVLAESQLVPLNVCRNQLLLNYIAKLITLPKHQNCTLIYPSPLLNTQ